MIDYSAFDEFPKIQTNRLILRPFESYDKEALFSMRTDPNIMEYIDVPRPNTLDDVVPFLEKNMNQFSQKNGINWVITLKETGEFIGFVGIHKIDEQNHRGEIGYSLKPAFWGNGIMTEALNEVISFAFDSLKLHGLDANVNPENIGSQAILKKLGFKKEAHFRENFFFDGNYLDSYIYCLLTSDWQRH